jgi:hypothetical protein
MVCLLIVAAFQAQLAAAPSISEDVPVPGGTPALVDALQINFSVDRSRFVSEVARLVYDNSEGKSVPTEIVLQRLRAHLGATANAEATADDFVQVPLSASTWSQAIFHRQVPSDRLFAAILSDRSAALLCRALAALDDETLRYLSAHPAVLTRLYERSPAAFAAFGDSLLIHDGRVDTPGGPAAAELWQGLLGEPVTQPDRFIRALYERNEGRVAYLFGTIAQLDRPHMAFALGLWMKDSAWRLDRFKALARVASTSCREWDIRTVPFARPVYDLAALVTRVRVREDGSPTGLVSRAFWSLVFERVDLSEPSDAATRPDPHPIDAPVDAAWLGELIVLRERHQRVDRLNQFAFGERVFQAGANATPMSTVVAIRALSSFPTLMLTLERMGMSEPDLYEAAAKQALRLSGLDGNRGYVAVAQFQGVLGLLGRMLVVGTIDHAVAQDLVASFMSVTLNPEGRYGSGIAQWIEGKLRPTLQAPGSGAGKPDIDLALVVALSGRPADGGAPQVLWEGQRYRLDLASAEARRLRRVREKQRGATLGIALALNAIGRTISHESVSRQTFDRAIAAIRATAEEVVPHKDSTEFTPTPPGVDAPRRSREFVERVVRESAPAEKALERSGDSTGLSKAAHFGEQVSEAAEAMLAEALVSWCYAIDIGDPDGTALLTGDVALRHDFGFGVRDADLRGRVEWALPRQEVAPNVPWHIKGSLLGLDVALAPLTLRRIVTDRMVEAPALTSNARDAFAASVALLNPLVLSDADRDSIAGAVDRGRARVMALNGTSADLDTIAGEIAMDGWRRRAVQWAIAHPTPATPVLSLFSLTELLVLGGGASEASLDNWGMSGLESTGCLCTRMAPPGRWQLWTGRPQLGLIAAAVPDLNLYVAMMLHDLRLPAPLAKSVLAAAVQDFIDEVKPTDASDWLTLVRAAQAVSRERFEDYVAAVAADGPLLPWGRVGDH